MWILFGVIGLIGLVVLLSWLVQRKLASISELAQEGNVDALVKALRSFSPDVTAQAANALAELRDPSAVPGLVTTYLNPISTAQAREACSQALAVMPDGQVVPSVIENMESGKEEIAIDFLRKFDRPEAREAVAKFDKQRAEAEAEVARRDSIVERLLTDGAEAARKTVVLPLPIETGGGVVASKIVGGMLTGGMMAAGPNKFTLDDFVSLPEKCSFCGCLPGKKERWATCYFKLASAGWGVVGVNTMGEAHLTYRVCSQCSKHDEKAKAIQISIDIEEQKALILNVNLLNPEIARQIQELNSITPVEEG